MCPHLTKIYVIENLIPLRSLSLSLSLSLIPSPSRPSQPSLSLSLFFSLLPSFLNPSIPPSQPPPLSLSFLLPPDPHSLLSLFLSFSLSFLPSSTPQSLPRSLPPSLSLSLSLSLFLTSPYNRLYWWNIILSSYPELGLISISTSTYIIRHWLLSFSLLVILWRHVPGNDREVVFDWHFRSRVMQLDSSCKGF